MCLFGMQLQVAHAFELRSEKPLDPEQASSSTIGHVMDVQNSKKWIRLHAAAGCSPTVTHSHAAKSLLLFKDGPVRFRLPQEHLLLQGFEFNLIKVISRGRIPREIGQLAGNSMALPVIECILAALAHTFPETFQKAACN